MVQQKNNGGSPTTIVMAFNVFLVSPTLVARFSLTFFVSDGFIFIL